MAEKMVFIKSKTRAFEEKIITYEYFPGFAISQKQKSIRSLHNSINEMYSGKDVLEISTKSDKEEGIQLSAFNLLYYHHELKELFHLENIFQSSKTFRDGGPYRDLLYVTPKEAKRDSRLKESGPLVGFELHGKMWPLNPRTMFYDWIYITALKQNPDIAEKLLEYDIFTDIEFNYKKSLNCQARAAAIFASLSQQGTLDEKTSSMEAFQTIY